SRDWSSDVCSSDLLLQRRHGFIEYDEGRIQIGSLRRVVFSLSGQSGICLDETFEISIVIARITGCVLDDPLQVRQCTGIILVLEVLEIEAIVNRLLLIAGLFRDRKSVV